MKKTIAALFLLCLFAAITAGVSQAWPSGAQEPPYEGAAPREYSIAGNTIPSITAVVGPRKMIRELPVEGANFVKMRYTYQSDSAREDVEAYLAALVSRHGCEESPKREPDRSDLRDDLVWQAVGRSQDPHYSLIIQAAITKDGYDIDFTMMPLYSAETYDFGDWQKPGPADPDDEGKSRNSDESMSTDTWSSSFASKDEKLEFLARYLVPFAEVLDAEYHIYYADNAGGRVPGPSYWDIRAALKVRAEDIPLWLDGYSEVPQNVVDMDWWAEIPMEGYGWDMDGAQFFKRPKELSYLVLFADEGIVLKRATVQ